MRVPRRGVGRLLVSLSLLAGLAGPNAASAAPPEGCVGFPSIPEAFICVTQWSPTNAVPSVSQGPGQTFVIPEFCAFECVGPTPVTVPNVVVTSGSGLIAVVTYNGATYPIAVPPAPLDVLIVQTQQAIAGALATAITTAAAAQEQAEEATRNTPGGAFVLAGEAVINCYGCGRSYGSVNGDAIMVDGGQVFTGSFSGSFNYFGSPSQCPVTGSATGYLYLPGGGTVSFNWTMVGGIAMISTMGAVNGVGTGTFAVTSEIGLPCGGQIAAAFTAAIAGI